MYRIRRVEERIAEVYPTDKIKSPVHLSIGQEAVSVGVCEALRPDDVVFGTYRSHALFLAKGGNLKAMIAELYGKATGAARGKGGSMHLIDLEAGVLGTSAVVGTTIPNAVGYAYAIKYRRENRLVVSFLGDGGTDEGVFQESLNFAALKKLPIIFICENNGYAIHTHQRLRHPALNICERARVVGMPAERIEDNDTIRIFERVKNAVDLIANGAIGPHFLECMTYRWKEHVGPNEDYQLGYRSKDEAEPWIRNDQVIKIGALLGEKEKRAIEDAVDAEIADAFACADADPFPEESELFTDVFK
ncbi:MAG: thiamine pyrophosphate-dependent dehydrogenase E1 component subunit alpha [Verrucomicrobia bacterium]|nr:thiamine pyrophosphate-dependent dehydrogenase E1 component subunit alpha [Verrucomicrobiota bacterium]